MLPKVSQSTPRWRPPEILQHEISTLIFMHATRLGETFGSLAALSEASDHFMPPIQWFYEVKLMSYCTRAPPTEELNWPPVTAVLAEVPETPSNKGKRI